MQACWFRIKCNFSWKSILRYVKIAGQIEQIKAFLSFDAPVPTPALDLEGLPKRDYTVEKTGQIRLF
jgi:hypothetical protein